MAASRSILALALLAATGSVGRAQPSEAPSNQFIAFRFDDSHVIAVVKVLDDLIEIGTNTVESGPPAAKYGFSYFDAPASLVAQVPPSLQSARWVVHAGPGRVLNATVEEVVAGDPACQTAVGLLLNISPSQVEQLKAVSNRYFVAEAQSTPRSDGDAAMSGVRELPRPAFTDARRVALESRLNEVMKREWPAVRDETEPEVTRMAASSVRYHRSWATERRRLADELSRGRVKLSYDVQAFRLDPSGLTSYFVRAEWLSGRRQAFAAALWLRGDTFEIVETNTRAASWLRTFEFQGAVDRSRLGLVLNVIDRDRDGWGEVVFAHNGYESVSIDVQKYSAGGFQSTDISFASGC